MTCAARGSYSAHIWDPIRRKPELIERYVGAIRARSDVVSPSDRRLLRRVAAHPFLLGFVDGGLALRRPTSEVRRRLFVMAAVLETNPRDADRYLPVRRSPLYLVLAGVIAYRAALRAAIGSVLVEWL